MATVRPATQDDYDAVMALDPDRSINDGLDYLPALYREFIQDNNFISIVAEIQGTVVCDI